LKRIKYERLYLPDKGTAGDYPNLAGTFARPIRWDLVATQRSDKLPEQVQRSIGGQINKGEALHALRGK
jgi:hypothetical protein